MGTRRYRRSGLQHRKALGVQRNGRNWRSGPNSFRRCRRYCAPWLKCLVPGCRDLWYLSTSPDGREDDVAELIVRQHCYVKVHRFREEVTVYNAQRDRKARRSRFFSLAVCAALVAGASIACSSGSSTASPGSIDTGSSSAGSSSPDRPLEPALTAKLDALLAGAVDGAGFPARSWVSGVRRGAMFGRPALPIQARQNRWNRTSIIESAV